MKKDAAFIQQYWGTVRGFYVFVLGGLRGRGNGGPVIGRSKDAAIAARMVAVGFLGCESVWRLYVPNGIKFSDIPIYE